MNRFPLWAERLYNQPVALAPFKNEVLCQFAQTRISGEIPAKVDATSLAALADDASFMTDSGRKAFASRDGIAVVPVRGTLVHRSGYLDAESGLLGYNKVLERVRAAVNDPEIGGVFMPYQSGGGECAGMFAAAEELASMSKAEGGKPIYVYLDEQACSAAYCLASGADAIFGRRECQGASIAAIFNAIDKSKAFEKLGLEPIVIRPEWADRKARGQPGERFDEDTIATFQRLVDEASEQLVEFVAAMRPISEAKIRDLRGEVFTGNDLLRFGLIDEIASETEAWAALKAEIAG